MNAVKKDVEQLVHKELAAADKKFPQFHSTHEGYAVILEEVEELSLELEDIENHLTGLWWQIKKDHNEGCNDRNKEAANMIKKSAVNAACEAIQAAAMCEKFLRIGENGKEDLK